MTKSKTSRKKLNKSTISVYHHWDISFVTGIFIVTFVNFYGKRADELKKLYYSRIEKVRKERIKEGQKEKDNEIKRLEEKLLVTPKSWWNDDHENLKIELEKVKNKSVESISGFLENEIAMELINELGGVLISTGDNIRIYEV